MQRQNLASRQPNRPLQRDRLAWAPLYLTKPRPRPGLCVTRCRTRVNTLRLAYQWSKALKCCLNPVSNHHNSAKAHLLLGFNHPLQGQCHGGRRQPERR